MALKFGAKKWFVFVISIFLLADLAILLGIPFLRQTLGFLFLTLLPGLLILQILKLNKIGFTEKAVLSVGLSISFLMLFGLLLNNLSLSLGYETPLTTVSLLISFSITFFVLAIIGYRTNKDSIFSLPNLNLTTPEKAFLIVPISFPALSILGTHLMKITDNNIILMFLLFLIPAYVVCVCFFNHKFPKRLYPVVIFLISISLLLIFMMRFPHICGHDVHIEYGIFFQTTFDNLHWVVLGHTPYGACLSISLLPTIFQSIMNVDAQEYLFKGVYVSICSFSPLAIYIISRKYVGELYAFLASFFFISELSFLSVAGNTRTSVAIFFAALVVLVFFNDKIDPVKRRILLIVFMLSMIVSHYSTAYAFFFITLGTFVGVEILLKRYTFKKVISLTLVLLFFAFIFFWYSQVTEAAFNSGVRFVEESFINLNRFFIEELRGEEVMLLTGKGLVHPILSRVSWVVTWCTFILICIGVLTMLRRYKEMVVISNVIRKKPDFLNTKFEMEYLVMAFVCAGLLVIVFALPYVSVGYGIRRLYSLVLIILSVCFVIGGMVLSKHFFFWQKKTCAKRKPWFFGKAFFVKEGFDGKNRQQTQNSSDVLAYLVILLILIPYFLFQTGAMCQICGAPMAYTLNSEGVGYDREYVHDSESCAAKWLNMNGKMNHKIYTPDGFGKWWLMSQGKISSNRIDHRAFSEGSNFRIGGYIYLNHNNVVNGKLSVTGKCNMSEYSDRFIGTNKIYDNGGSEVYKTWK
jgi:uncharacterized membrane protein